MYAPRFAFRLPSGERKILRLWIAIAHRDGRLTTDDFSGAFQTYNSKKTFSKGLFVLYDGHAVRLW